MSGPVTLLFNPVMLFQVLVALRLRNDGYGRKAEVRALSRLPRRIGLPPERRKQAELL